MKNITLNSQQQSKSPEHFRKLSTGELKSTFGYDSLNDKQKEIYNAFVDYGENQNAETLFSKIKEYGLKVANGVDKTFDDFLLQIKGNGIAVECERNNSDIIKVFLRYKVISQNCGICAGLMLLLQHQKRFWC